MGVSGDFEAKVAASVLVELFKEGLKGLKEADTWMRGKTKQYDPLGRGARAYGEAMIKRYNQMQIFGQPKPKPLSSIVVDVNILERPHYLQVSTADALQEALGTDLRTFGTPKDACPSKDVIDRVQRVTVLGKPGAGKTTLLKWTMMQALADGFTFKALPIFVGLKEWADKQVSLLDYIAEQFEICQFPDAAAFVERMLKKGRCLVLFDGYDEVPEAQEDAVQQLKDFVDSYPDNRYILSCRIAAYHQTFEGFELVEVADFSDDQIAAFVSRWFGKDDVKATQCLERLNKSTTVKELAKTPLLLTMLCIRFEDAGDFESNRAELYAGALQALLEKWDASRSIERRPVYQNMSTAKKEMLLSHLAAPTFGDEAYFVPRRVLEALIRDFIKHRPGVKQSHLDVDSRRVLKAIEANHGLLVERAQGVYSFSHLTFQEYFTAKYIVDHRDEGTLGQLIDDHLFDARWREVIVLVAGLLPTRAVADQFVQGLREQLHTHARSHNLVDVLQASGRIVRSDSPYTQSASRAFALFYTLTQLLYLDGALALSRARDLDQDGALALARDEDLSLALDKVLAWDGDLALARDGALALSRALDKVLARDRDLSLDLALDRNRASVLALDEAWALVGDRDQAISTYLYGTQVLVSCLAPEVYMSGAVRAELLEGLLLED